jgi:hypothetical protein
VTLNKVAAIVGRGPGRIPAATIANTKNTNEGLADRQERLRRREEEIEGRSKLSGDAPLQSAC